MAEQGNLRVGVVILGAGASSRMGQPKLVLPWAGKTVIAHMIDLWRSLSAAQIAVVISRGSSALVQELDRSGLESNNRIVNEKPALGMFSSVQGAARWPHWAPDLTHVVLTLGDQPQI